MEYIACFGDSLIQGFPFSQQYSWVAHAEIADKYKMLNYGMCGDCCDEIFYRMRQFALPEYVQHILFLGGANDILQGRRYEDTLNDYLRVLNWCTDNNYHLCFVLPFITADEFLNRKIFNLRQDIVHRFSDKVFLLDLQPAIGLDEKTRQKAYLDGVHPLSPTYKAMGEYARPFITEWLKQCEA